MEEDVSELNGSEDLVRPSSNEKKKKGAKVLPKEKDAGKHVRFGGSLW
jgi:hypothetical protein